MLEKRAKMIEENEVYLREQKDAFTKALETTENLDPSSREPVSAGDHMKTMLTISFVIWYMHGEFYKLHVDHPPTHKQRPYTIIMGTIMEAASMACVTYAAVRKRDHFFFNFFLILVDGLVMIFLGVLFDKVMCGLSAFFTFLALSVLMCWQSTKRRRWLVDSRARLEIKCNELIDKIVCGDAAKEEAEKKAEEERQKKQAEEERERKQVEDIQHVVLDMSSSQGGSSRRRRS
jgi:hypothetical protein